MNDDGNTELGRLLTRTLASLRDGGPSDEQLTVLARTLALYEREVQLALEASRSPQDGDPTGDPAEVDCEESRAGLQRRLDEYLGRIEGFSKALSLLLGHEAVTEVSHRARALREKETDSR